ncbi:MAG: mechanosensitive ion channel [Muribaculaceae bacterium]|jgi:small conductance mechanosensitive channel|nr:mechanosensitive ion channel [Muribaculaceae bacterium]MBR3729079.1 mechanosensitive ion channel [Muribaculaceae bacterium]
MLLDKILMQIPVAAPDTVAANKIKEATNVVTAHVDSLATQLHPDSIAAMTPAKIVDKFKYLDVGSLVTSLSSQIISLGLRILAAIVIFYIGKFIINKIYSVARAIMVRKDFDRSLISFLLSFIKITLLFLLIITVIGVLGIETSSFIAIFASAGVAIGMALSGTLQNFAGGVLILLLKPYKVGDYIEFGELKGTVREIQIFNTIINTYNNDRIVIPNGGLATSSLKNFSAEPYHRVEWRVGISYGDNVDTARKVVLDILGADERIVHTDADVKEDEQPQQEVAEETEQQSMPWWKRLFHWQRRHAEELRETHEAKLAALLPKPNYAPMVAVESLDDSQVTLIVRAWTEIANYWNVLYDVNEQIYKQLPQHGIRFPFPQMDVHVNS